MRPTGSAHSRRSRRSERRSRALLEGVPDNIYRVAREGHRFLDIRWADPTRLPVPQERFIGGTVHDLGLPGDLADRFIELAERAFQTGGVQSLEYEVPQADGETIHLEARVVPSGDTEYFVIVRDVSDRKRAELALKAQADFLSEMGDATPSFLAIVAPDGTMSRQPINRPLREFTGLDADDAAHRVFWELISAPEDAAEAERVIREVTATGKAVSTESRWLARGGERRLIAWTCTPLPDMEPGRSYHLVSGVDVTARARQEKEQAALPASRRRRGERASRGAGVRPGHRGGRRLLDAHSANVVRFDPDGKAAVILGRWSEPGVFAEKVGVSVPTAGRPGAPCPQDGPPRPLRPRREHQSDTAGRSAPGTRRQLGGGRADRRLREALGGGQRLVDGGHVFPAGSEDRIGEFTRLVSLALANEETREQLAASRARIVEAGDAERRRLERNLHDGAQQRLVSLSLSLRLAQARLRATRPLRTSCSAGRRGAGARARGAARARARDPPGRADRPRARPGARVARRPGAAPRRPDSGPDDRLPGPGGGRGLLRRGRGPDERRQVRATPRASACPSRASTDTPCVEVADDGRGGADPARGSGLRGLVDRVEALEGRLASRARRARARAFAPRSRCNAGRAFRTSRRVLASRGHLLAPCLRGRRAGSLGSPDDRPERT